MVSLMQNTVIICTIPCDCTHWPFLDSSHLHSFAVLELLDGMQCHWTVWTLFFNDNIPYRWYIEHVWPRDESCLHAKKSKAGWWKREPADVCWKSFACTGSFVGWTRQKFPPDDVLSVEMEFGWVMPEYILYNRLYIENVFAFDWCFDSFARSLFNAKTPRMSIQHPASCWKRFWNATPMPPRPDLAQVVAPGAEWGCIYSTHEIPFALCNDIWLCIFWIEMCPFLGKSCKWIPFTNRFQTCALGPGLPKTIEPVRQLRRHAIVGHASMEFWTVQSQRTLWTETCHWDVIEVKHSLSFVVSFPSL